MKALQKLTSILAVIFYLCAAGSTVCFVLFRLTDKSLLFDFGNILITGWICNPAALLSIFFGKKHRFLPLLVYMLCGMALVALTGGV